MVLALTMKMSISGCVNDGTLIFTKPLSNVCKILYSFVSMSANVCKMLYYEMLYLLDVSKCV